MEGRNGPVKCGWVIALVVWLLGVAAAGAQKYDKIWEEIERATKEDLPRTALERTEKLIDLAEKKGDAGWLLQGWLRRVQLCVDVSPDSIGRLISETELRLGRAGSGTAEESCYHIVMAWLESAQDERLNPGARAEATKHYLRAMDHPEVLVRSKASKLVPFVTEGEDSRYYGDDMLSVVVRAVSTGLAEVEGLEDSVREVYHKALDEYRRARNGDAQVLMTLDSIETEERLGAEETAIISAIKDVIDKEGARDVTALAYLMLAERLDVDAAQQSYELLKEALGRYPGSKLENNFRNKKRELVRPTLRVEFPCNVTYPEKGQEILEITYRNIQKATLRLYRTNLDAKEVGPSNRLNVGIDRAARELYSEMPLPVRQQSPCVPCTDSFEFRVPNEPGIYVVEITATGVESAETILYVSDLHLLQMPMEKGKTRIVVSRASDGSPVAGASVELTSAERDVASKTWQTDAWGEVEVDWEQGESFYLYASTFDDKALPCVPLASSYDSYRERDQVVRRAVLYTDRALYRPGQEVKVGGIYYRKQGDSVSVVPGAEVTLRMLDANYEEIGKKDVTTDEYGNISSSFVLPGATLKGRFSITASAGGRANFRVEDYKRPTFHVSFDEPDVLYHFGDTVLLTGRVRTYSDFPLSSVRVGISIRRRSTFWRVADEEVLRMDTLLTDANGEFVLPVYLDVASKMGDTDWARLPRRYAFEVSAVAVSGDGEAHETQKVLFCGNRSAYLSTSIPSLLCREQADSFMVRQTNAAGSQIGGVASYALYSLVGGAKEAVATGLWSFNVQISADVLTRFASGDYELTVMPQDCADSLVTLRHRFSLFSLTDSRPASDHVMVYCPDPQFPGGESSVFVAIPDSNVTLRYDLFARGELIDHRVMRMSDTAFVFTYRYDESFGDGLSATFAYVRRGDVWREKVQLLKPLPDKRLSLRWKTFRDRSEPGADESWTLQVLKDGVPVSASLLAVLYDASLDSFLPHKWTLSPGFSRHVAGRNWRTSYVRKLSLNLLAPLELLSTVQPEFSHLPDCTLSLGGSASPIRFMRDRALTLDAPSPSMSKATATSLTESEDVADSTTVESVSSDQHYNSMLIDSDALRSDFSETAFFFPALFTDADGNAAFQFRIPESLTHWHFRALAHTKELDYALLDTTVTVSKPFMVEPNLPRFLRAGDSAVVAASLRNSGGRSCEGVVKMQFVEIATGDLVFSESAPFLLEPGASQVVNFTFSPDSCFGVLECRILAEGDEFGDGESVLLPVLPDVQRLTRSKPLSFVGSGRHEVNLADLLPSDADAASDSRLTVEYTDEPFWLSLTALPSLASSSRGDALSLATRYYSLSLAALLPSFSPQLLQIVTERSDSRSDSLLLLLERNQSLRDILLSETPWMADARGERQRLRTIAALLDTTVVDESRRDCLGNLLRLQDPSGGWSWWDGMKPRFLTTLRVCELLLRLSSVTVEAGLTDAYSSRYEDAVRRAIRFCDSEATERVLGMRDQQRRAGEEPRLDLSLLLYLYVCSLDRAELTADRLYLLEVLEHSVYDYDMYEKSLAANILLWGGKRSLAEQIVQSIREHTVEQVGLGRYFDTYSAPFSRSSYRIPTQVAALCALRTVSPDDSLTLNSMLQYLLQAKRTESWETTAATADALYYLFRYHAAGSAHSADPTRITLHFSSGEQIEVNDLASDSSLGQALGYRFLTIDSLSASPCSLVVDKTGSSLSFGGVYASYLAPVAETIATGAAQLSTTYFVRRGADWIPVDEAASLVKGDLIKARYAFSMPQDCDYVYLACGRAACLEPVANVSGYLPSEGCYRSVGDAVDNYFYETMPKGEHVLEVFYRVDRSGSYLTSVPALQCLYAPELSALGKAFKFQIR